jgi:hypothetical protein
MTENHRTLSIEILVTGLIAGTLDITGAILNYIIPNYRDPIIIFKFIASALLGAGAAFTGGWWVPVLGLFLHYLIATIWTALFFLTYLKINKIVPNKFVAGVLYGLFVWLIMNRVVLPLTLVPKFPFNLRSAAIGAAILIVAIGLPISIRATKYYATRWLK